MIDINRWYYYTQLHSIKIFLIALSTTLQTLFTLYSNIHYHYLHRYIGLLYGKEFAGEVSLVSLCTIYW
jgi:hypothetical protein